MSWWTDTGRSAFTNLVLTPGAVTGFNALQGMMPGKPTGDAGGGGTGGMDGMLAQLFMQQQGQNQNQQQQNPYIGGQGLI